MNAWAWVGVGLGAWVASNALLAWFMIASGRRDPRRRHRLAPPRLVIQPRDQGGQERPPSVVSLRSRRATE